MPVTIEDAYAIARLLKDKNPYIRGIDFFGSTQRNGTGRDLDFLILVDEKLAQEWWSDMTDIAVRMPTALFFIRRIMKRFWPALDELSIHERKGRRNARVSQMLGTSLPDFAYAYRPGMKIDAWLLPEDWQKGSALNEESISKLFPLTSSPRTVSFLTSLAREAVRIA